jgi:hypothetical protein
MSKNETLGQALEKEGKEDQKSICTTATLGLTKSECVDLLESHDVGLKRHDKESFIRLLKHRINEGDSLLPWKDVKLTDEVVGNTW